MVFTMAAKVTALLLTLPSVANGIPILPPPQADISLTENVSHSAALATTPGLEHLLGPDVPHIEDPTKVLGPDIIDPTVLTKGISWIKEMFQWRKQQEIEMIQREIMKRLGLGGSSTKPAKNNTTKPSKSGKKNSKRWFKWGFAETDWEKKVTDPAIPLEPDNMPAEITLINATPYPWRRGYIHSYQMISWEHNWPKYIQPGQTVRVTSSVEALSPWDAAGEVVYHLEGVSKPASFQISRRTPQTKDHIFKGDIPNEISVSYKENLKSFNTRKNSVKKLNCRELFPGGCQWFLAGKEDDFISAGEAGPGWMSEKMEQIGHIPLRELSIPRSHHAGMYKMVEVFGLGSMYNALTQYRDLTYQLTEGGVRVIDIRPFLKYEKKGSRTYESHGSVVGGNWHGGLGVTLKTMVDQVNAFNEKYPGELIIWDIHPNQALVRHLDGKVEQMSEGDRAIMYKEFKRLKHRVQVPNRGDLTKWPLEKFVGNGTSGVLIRTRREWRKDKSFPGGSEGFVTEANFPVHQIWANSQDTSGLIKATVKDLKECKTNRTSELFFADWILTQQGIDVVVGGKFIADSAITTYKAMFYDLWEALTMDRYPNWIATDGILSSEAKSFAMAINHCFAGMRCGDIHPSKKLRFEPDDEQEFYPTLTWMDDLAEVKGKEKKLAGKRAKGGKARS